MLNRRSWILRCVISAGVLISHYALAQEADKAAAASVSATATAAEIQQGRQLFQGISRFAQGGPACVACHDVQNDAVIGGGILAADLTAVFSRIGQDGLVDVLPRAASASPFPLMQAAYQGKAVSDSEARALGAFLQQVDQQQATQKHIDYGTRMLVGGSAGVITMLGVFSLLGQGRKRKSVNQAIYDRQIRSE